MSRPLGDYGIGFRIPKEAFSDMFAPPKPRTRRQRLRDWWRYEVVWRVSHAWDALIPWKCGYR